MSEAVISCEGLGKSYLIGHQGRQERYTALRDVMANHARNLWDRTRRAMRGQSSVAGREIEEFWALKDVSFEVKRGEVLGIIGRNGAGKSTLLKVLSRITEPTEGRVTLRGRVASLLEVGTGFHPELTGRENIFLNGAILGMTRAEIKRKFDEIVAFAEVEKFLDTPVKRYSSGMYVRLAFAVAAHLEPEILVVDEVLAVGDAEFQKKCLGKMQDVSRGGRTVLFVSHNMGAVQSLCRRCILMSLGRIREDESTSHVVAAYLTSASDDADDVVKRIDRQGDRSVIVSRITMHNSHGLPSSNIQTGDDVALRIDYLNSTQEVASDMEVCVGIYDNLGHAVTFLENRPLNQVLDAKAGHGTLRCEIRKLPLMPGNYYVNVHFHCGSRLLDWIQQAYRFTVIEGDYYGTGKLPFSGLGGVFLQHSWVNGQSELEAV